RSVANLVEASRTAYSPWEVRHGGSPSFSRDLRHPRLLAAQRPARVKVDRGACAQLATVRGGNHDGRTPLRGRRLARRHAAASCETGARSPRSGLQRCSGPERRRRVRDPDGQERLHHPRLFDPRTTYPPGHPQAPLPHRTGRPPVAPGGDRPTPCGRPASVRGAARAEREAAVGLGTGFLEGVPVHGSRGRGEGQVRRGQPSQGRETPAVLAVRHAARSSGWRGGEWRCAAPSCLATLRRSVGALTLLRSVAKRTTAGRENRMDTGDDGRVRRSYELYRRALE